LSKSALSTNARTRLFVGLLLFLALGAFTGAVGLITSGKRLIQERDILATRGVRTRATVVSVRSSSRRITITTDVCFRFATPSELVRCQTLGGRVGYSAGGPVDIIYDPQNPSLALIAPLSESAGPHHIVLGAVFGVVGLMLVGLAVWWILRRRRATLEAATGVRRR
jgi:uncharacterized protein DUF3592